MDRPERAGKIRLPLLRLPPHSTILDVGCSSGAITAALAARGFEVLGIDRSYRLLASGQVSNDGSRPQSYRGAQADARHLPIPDAAFDGAVTIEILEHIDEYTRALAEIHRILRPGGRLCIGYPTYHTERLFGRLNERYFEYAQHTTTPRRLAELKRALRASGFRVTAVSGENFEWGIWGALLNGLGAAFDPTGRPQTHLGVDRVFWLLWDVLIKLRLALPLVWFGNRTFPRSWYIYCEKVAG